MTPATTMRVGKVSARTLPRRLALTKTFIRELECPADQRVVVVYDVAVPSLCVHVSKRGRSFYIYRKLHGRPLRYKLGPFPDLSVENARKLAQKHLGLLVEGVDPREERRRIRTSVTLKELFDRWDREHAEPRHTPKTRLTDKNRFETCFAGWSNKKIATIREDHVRAFHVELAETRGKTTANRAVQLLRRLLNFARVNPNPAGNRAISFFREKSRDRFLQADELPRFIRALDAEPNETLRDFFYVALLTGARRSNVQSMRWDELDLDRSTWTIPAEKFKNHEPQHVHLAESTKTILRRRIEEAKAKVESGDRRYEGWVFPSKRLAAKTPHLTEPKAAWARVLKHAGIRDLRVHDLRRTLGSWQAVLGASLPVIGKSLGHLNQATTAIYARLNLDPVRTSVDAAATAMLAAAAKLEDDGISNS